MQGGERRKEDEESKILNFVLFLFFLSFFLSFSFVPHAARRKITRSSDLPLLEEVVPLVVDDDKGGKVLHLDAPHGLHAELCVLLWGSKNEGA